MYMPSFAWSILPMLVLTYSLSAAEYEAHVFKGSADKTQPYRLLKPDHYDKSKHYPLVLLLHGFGERGTDNEKPVKTKSSGASLFLKEKVRERFPCFVLVPQAPESGSRNPISTLPRHFANGPRIQSCSPVCRFRH